MRTETQMTRTYRTWVAMRTRCNNPNATQYSYYGGRGITICDRWNSYANFLADMGEVPTGRTIDRINNDGNYEPGNCRWATLLEQRRNRRGVRLITHDGLTMTLTEWSQKLGIKYGTLYRRVATGQWGIEDAFSRGHYYSPTREANVPRCPHCGGALKGWRKLKNVI